MPEASCSNSSTSRPRTWLGFVRDHVLAFLLLVGFPALVTAIAPVSWIKFQRQGETVTASADICLLFVIPYRSQTISPLVGVDDQFVAGHLTYDSRNRPSSRSEDEAFLVLHGKDDVLKVPVTPFNIQSVSSRAKDFLTDPQSTELRMTVVANWKFSVVVGGFISLLTVLYFVAIGSSIIAGLGSLFRKRTPPARS